MLRSVRRSEDVGRRGRTRTGQEVQAEAAGEALSYFGTINGCRKIVELVIWAQVDGA
jgi:hypothetical protein